MPRDAVDLWFVIPLSTNTLPYLVGVLPHAGGHGSGDLALESKACLRSVRSPVSGSAEDLQRRSGEPRQWTHVDTVHFNLQTQQ